MIIIFVFILGLAIGSFISASAWRFHELEAIKKSIESSNGNNKSTSSSQLPTLNPQKLSITKGRSMCEHCGHRLSTRDLFPLVSWLSLRGKCRYCKKKLSWEYPAVELITGLLFVVSFNAWNFNESFDYISFSFWLLILGGLIFLALYDIKWLLLPNKIIYPLIITSVVLVVLEAVFYGGGVELVRDRVLGLVFIGGIFYFLFIISKGKWIGGGDVKLATFIGVSLGLSKSVLVFVLAFNTAALVILPLLLLGVVKRKTPVPFGPFLILATTVSVLYGNELIQWYSDKFLYGLI